MSTENENCTWIEYHPKVTTNLTAEALAYQGSVVDELNHFNYEGHNAACSTARKPGGNDKGVNVYSIMEAILVISFWATKYYEDVWRSIDPNIMEWFQIKHFNYMIQIQYNWSNPDSLP